MSPRALVKKSPGLKGLVSDISTKRAMPFLKWAGGKSQLLASYDEHFPEKFNNYFEPFTGGGAVFFRMRNKHGAFNAKLTDLNQELINCYTQIRDNLDKLVVDLKTHRNEADYFYELRSLDPTSLSPTQRASRLLYLNKTCFNGLYRVNSKGRFNVPYGFYKNPATCNEANLKACHDTLQGAKLECSPFDNVLKHAQKGDFVYFDPPYHPLTSTSNFTSYTKNCFSADDQEQLADTFLQLHKRGCKVMLSNSDCEFVRELYSEFRIETVYAIRAINCKAEGRGRISEVLVLNY